MQKKKTYPLYFFLLLFFFTAVSFAQTTVTGKIVDAVTREPLPFVNLIFKGTTDGGTTDIEGVYTITTSSASDSIIISYVGYTNVTHYIKNGISQTVNIKLHQGVDLVEVVVKPGENPAHRILKKIIHHKNENNQEYLNAYQYEVYNKIEFDLNNLNKNFQKNRLLKPFSFIFNDIDSSNVKEKPHLPVFMTESLSDFYYKRSPKVKNEIILASKVAGVENESVSQFMGEMYQNVNVYDNTILVFGKNFISPISDNALLFYKFYLIDSMVLDGHKCYQLQFKPKFKQDLAFTGNLWAADTSFAIKQLEMSMSPEANINFINSTYIVQVYNKVDNAWMMEKERLVIDFNPLPVKSRNKQTFGIYGRKTASYSNFKINQPHPDTFYSLTNNLKVADDAFNKNEDFWLKSRHDSLSINEKKIYTMVDTLQTLPVYKIYKNILQMLTTGYIIHGNFEYGPYYNMYSYNSIEGNRFRLGGRTSNKFSKWYQLNGYAAYGMLDQKFKYSMGFLSLLEKGAHRTLIGLNYKNDNEILGQSQNSFTVDNVLTSFIRITPLRNMTNVKQVTTYFERWWFNGFSTKLSFNNRIMMPLGTFHYEYYKKPNEIAWKDEITTSEIQFQTRFAFNEKYIDGEFIRMSLSTHYPILQAQYTLGIRNLFGSDYNYHKLAISVDDRIRINPIGYFDYLLSYGKIWGQVPYPLLELHGGNETYIYDLYAYNGMNYYEFGSDEYASAAITHHFDGFFLNKIPLMKKLKWREVVSGKTIIGSVNDKNRQQLIFPATLQALNHGPYVEVSAGIENIFSILRIEGVWRLTYLDHDRALPFTIKGSLQFKF